jgi:hypothetical protein
MTHFSKEEIEFMKLKYEQGATTYKIADLFNCNKSSVFRLFKRTKFKLRSGTWHLKYSAPRFNWKGGRIISRGYARVWVSKRRYVSEHRMIWEKINNKNLPNGWIVHHLNGIKTDNRPENLFAMDRSKHHSLRFPYERRIRELEIKIEKLIQTNLDFDFERKEETEPEYICQDCGTESNGTWFGFDNEWKCSSCYENWRNKLLS